nr:unnamed protein product [Digitaria exilis]
MSQSVDLCPSAWGQDRGGSRGFSWDHGSRRPVQLLAGIDPPIECDATRLSGSGFDLAVVVGPTRQPLDRNRGLRALGRAPPRYGRLPPHRPYIKERRRNGFSSLHSRSLFVVFLTIVEMASKGSSSSAQLRPWARSTAPVAALESLVSRGLLCPRTAHEEWISPHPSHKTPSPPAGYVVSFMAYHVRCFAVPAHRFVCEVLHHFGVELHALAPNGVQQMANFVALCEGYLGIGPDFNLFLLFVRPHGVLAPWGYCSLQAKQSRVDKFPRSELWGSNKDWNKGWFYQKNHHAAGEGAGALAVRPEAADRKKLAPHLDCLAKLRSCDLTGIGIAEAFHQRRVAPLMPRPLRLFEMLPSTSEAELRASLVSRVVPSEDEIRARLAGLVDSQRAAFMVIPTPGQPPMLPGPRRPPRLKRGLARGATRPRRGLAEEPRKREDTKKRLHRQERRRERERKERRGEEVGLDLASSCDEEENPGGSFPLLGDYTVVDPVAHDEQHYPPHLQAPAGGGVPCALILLLQADAVGGSPPRHVEQIGQESGPVIAPVNRLRRDAPPAVVPDSLEPRTPAEPRRADPCPTRAEGSAPPPALGGSSSGPGSVEPAQMPVAPSPPAPSPPVGAGVTYVQASSPVAGEAAGSAEQAMDVEASAEAAAGGEPGASTMVSATKPLPTAAAPMEGVVVGAPLEAPIADRHRAALDEPRWSVQDLFGEAEARARSKSEPPAASSALTLVSVLEPPSTAAPAGPSGSGDDHGIAPPAQGEPAMATFPATLLQMALMLRTVAIPSSRSMLLALSRTRSIEQEAINQARRAWDVANSSRDAEASSARCISELERELAAQASAHQEELVVLRAELGSIRTDATDVRSGAGLPGFQAQVDTLREERAAAVRACVDAQAERNQAVAAKEEAEGACAQLSELAQTSTGRVETWGPPCPRRTNPWRRRTRRSTVCPPSPSIALHPSLKSRVADGITHRNTLLSRFGMLRDATGAVLSRLGFPLSEDVERPQGSPPRCGELRAVAVSMLDALEVPMSGDPARLPAELDHVPARVGALAKQSLVRGVQEAFTLVRSHYDGIRFDRMAAGFPNEFTTEALDAMAEELRGPAEQFANGLAPTTDEEGNPVDGADTDQAL